jgi:hypothetical protein
VFGVIPKPFGALECLCFGRCQRLAHLQGHHRRDLLGLGLQQVGRTCGPLGALGKTRVAVSRATMNRAARILAEWNTRVAACDSFTPSEARKNDELSTLRTKLVAKTRECTDIRHQLGAAATAIAALHHDNTPLRQELDQRDRLIALRVDR